MPIGHPMVIVIGGGIAGLAAAYHLRESAERIEVVVLEAGARLGGPLRTIERDGFIIETGADSFITDKPSARDLAIKLRLEGELVGTDERFRKTHVVRAGRLAEIPAGFSLLAPTHLGPVMRSTILSPLGKLRIALEPLVRRSNRDGDESLASFVTRRLGREVLERIAQPLAGGIYTADPARLSMRATMHRFLDYERQFGSVIRGLRAAQANAAPADARTSGARWSLFQSLHRGVGILVQALAARLEGSINLNIRAVALEHDSSDARWRVILADGGALEADAVICAAPTPIAARLLKPHDPLLAANLEAISYSSAATVNLAFRASDFPRPPDSFGFVVPSIERRRIIAGSFTSLKFPGRAPDGMVLLRAFLGGSLDTRMMELDDREMIAATREEFRDLLGVSAVPILAHVERWPDSMPQYEVGHLERVAEIERRADAIACFALAGAAYRGVGIPDCIHGGERAAAKIVADLARCAP